MFNNSKNKILLLLIMGSLFSTKTMAYVVKNGIDSDNLFFHVNTDNANGGYLEVGNSGTGEEDTNAGPSGSSAGAIGSRAITAGIKAKAKGLDSIAIGTSSSAEGLSSISIGMYANSTKYDGIALGRQADATIERSVALGDYSTTTERGSQTEGNSSDYLKQEIDGKNKIDLTFAGGDSVVGVVSVGGERKKPKVLRSMAISTEGPPETRRIQNVAPGLISTASTDAVNGSQLYALAKEVANISVSGYFHVNTSTETESGNSGTGDSNTNYGKHDEAGGATGQTSLAAGINAKASGRNSLAIGSNSTAKEENSIVLGSDSKDRAFTKPTSFKSSNLTFGDFSGNAIGVVSVGDKDTERQIINMAPGEISATSTDAINGSQLYATNNILGNVGKSVVNNFGGNAKIDENGNITFTDIGGTGENTIHDAIKEYSDKVKENSTKIEENKKEIEANKENIRKNSLDIAENKKEIDTNKESIRKNSLDIAENKKAILASKTEVFSSDESVKITSSNGDNGQTKYDLSVKVKNIDIKAGNNINVEKNADIYTISSKDTSASTSAASDYLIVNKENAKNVDGVEVTNYKVDLSEETKAKIENTSNNSAQIQRNSEKIENLNDDLHHVGSLSAAMAALNPIQYDSKKPNQIMAGIGHYRDHQAVAVGAAHYINENLLLTAGVAIGGEKRVKSMANVGLTWKFGKGNDDNTPEEYKDGPISSIYAMQEKITKLEIENANYKLKIAELENKLNLLIENMSK
ncbi:MAG: YadA-like family protein [Fusobacterium gastrosuis]|uniref:YadA-like family protein n=1 Tax=Fusobacterium gastrosuis TaxID=1755100 RepID=UPI002A8890AC|nr:YadA-like family protein [Fusobacterium gastrosuis]